MATDCTQIGNLKALDYESGEAHLSRRWSCVAGTPYANRNRLILRSTDETTRRD